MVNVDYKDEINSFIKVQVPKARQAY